MKKRGEGVDRVRRLASGSRSPPVQSPGPSTVHRLGMLLYLYHVASHVTSFLGQGESTACSVGWFISLLIREEILLAGLCERKILFRLEIYNRLRQATAKLTSN